MDFVVLNLFNQFVIYFCTNIHFVKCCFIKASFGSIFAVYDAKCARKTREKINFLAWSFCAAKLFFISEKMLNSTANSICISELCCFLHRAKQEI
jgi:hypothetical protein